MYFDSHTHFNDPRFDGDRADILRSLEKKGFLLMNVGCSLTSSKDAIALSETYPFVYAAVGSHPDDAGAFSDAYIDEYRALAAHPRVRAIGEIGLDYHYDDNPPEVQKVCFRRQLELAREVDLPVIIHEREAHGDAMEILRDFPEVRGVFHCYSGSVEMAKQLVKRGFYIGFTGVLTFKNARKAVETAREMPLDRILVETDCPFMAPEPHRGERCDSRLLPLIVSRLAEIRGISPEETADATAKNAKKLFQIDET